MPRAYTVATAALALGVSTKWLDNILSHFQIPGVQQQRQGISRRLTSEALLILAAAVLFTNELGIPMARALEFAVRAIADNGRLTLGPQLRILADVPSLQTDLAKRLEHAVEVAPLPRRGRPPKKTTGRLE